MSKKFEVPDFETNGREFLKEAQRVAGSESVKFFKESFVKMGFTDSSFKAWKKTSNPLAGKRTMYKMGTLMQSVRRVEQNKQRIVVESDTEYSEIHNDGGSITVTPRMKRFFWARYYELSGKIKKTKAGKVSNSRSNVQASAKAEFCRRMALMKVGSVIKIPQRQFMGNSQAMMDLIDAELQRRIEENFRNIPPITGV